MIRLYVTKKQVTAFINKATKSGIWSRENLLQAANKILDDLNEFPNDNHAQIKFYSKIKAELETWFEVFTSTEEDGTETIESFDTLAEADDYVAKNPEQNLFIDKWRTNKQGENEKVKIK
jgi:ElaB/YqjD/DUF883 family membrane-anchored ribosome-binding protein